VTNDDDVLEKLDLIIRLLAIPVVAGQRKSASILLLSEMGMDRNLIAAICETSPHAVSVVLSSARKRREGGTEEEDSTNGGD
jgi:hypothetical protein